MFKLPFEGKEKFQKLLGCHDFESWFWTLNSPDSRFDGLQTIQLGDFKTLIFLPCKHLQYYCKINFWILCQSSKAFRYSTELILPQFRCNEIEVFKPCRLLKQMLDNSCWKYKQLKFCFQFKKTRSVPEGLELLFVFYFVSFWVPLKTISKRILYSSCRCSRPPLTNPTNTRILPVVVLLWRRSF